MTDHSTPAPLEILYEDARLAIINKPAKMLVHRSPIATEDTVFLVELAQARFGRPVHPVHRLDRGTSGALLVALDPECASVLGRMMMAGAIDKRYATLSRGHIERATLIDHAITSPRDFDSDPRPTERHPAQTLVVPVAQRVIPVACGPYETTRVTLSAVELFTGRRHQIRKHMKHIAHPVIGDSTYGKGPLNRALADWFGFDRMWLHAVRLDFRHPFTGEALSVRAMPDGDLARGLTRLGCEEDFEALLSRPFTSLQQARDQGL